MLTELAFSGMCPFVCTSILQFRTCMLQSLAQAAKHDTIMKKLQVL